MVSVKHVFAAATFVALAACTPPGARAGFTAPYEIFDGERALELTEQCSRPSPGPVSGTWTPTEAQIRAMEPALVTRVAEELTNANAQENAAAYIRQYGGLVINGRRVIYAHGFVLRDEDPDEGWRSHPMVICDGGEITFGVEYDPETRTFANFAFNGGF
jgi:hypothetical protein